jgi:hypothetical protein
LVERGPEKAGVGGSIPSLATNLFKNVTPLKERVKISLANNTRTSVCLIFTFKILPTPAPCFWSWRLAAGPSWQKLRLDIQVVWDLCQARKDRRSLIVDHDAKV